MQKVFTDNFNTIDSRHWSHKGYTVYENWHPIGFQLSNGEVWRNKYFVYRPNTDNSHFAEASTLDDAKQFIEEDISND